MRSWIVALGLVALFAFAARHRAPAVYGAALDGTSPPASALGLIFLGAFFVRPSALARARRATRRVGDKDERARLEACLRSLDGVDRRLGPIGVRLFRAPRRPRRPTPIGTEQVHLDAHLLRWEEWLQRRARIASRVERVAAEIAALAEQLREGVLEPGALERIEAEAAHLDDLAREAEGLIAPGPPLLSRS